MARLAFGAKCGSDGRPPNRCGAAPARPGRSDASAAVPSPMAPAWKKCRRVIARPYSFVGVMVVAPLGVVCPPPLAPCTRGEGVLFTVSRLLKGAKRQARRGQVSALVQHLVQVQHRAGEHGPRGQLV